MMHLDCKLTIDERINQSYGGIVSSSLSILGSIGTIIFIVYNNHKHKLAVAASIANANKNTNNNMAEFRYSTRPSFTIHHQQDSENNTLTTSNTVSSLSPSSSQLSLNNSTLSSPTVSPTQSPNNSFSDYKQIKELMKPNSSTTSIAAPSLSSSSSKPIASTSKTKSSRSRNDSSKDRLSKFVLHLAFSDFLAALFVLVSRVMLAKFDNDFIKSPIDSRNQKNPGLSFCTLSSGLVGFAFLSSILWTLAISLNIYRLFSNYKKRSFYIYYVVCWIIPFMCGIGLMATSDMSSQDELSWCTINRLSLLFLFYIPMVLSVILSVILTFKIKSKFKTLSLSLSKVNIKNLKTKIVNRLNLFTIVFIICWSMSIINFGAMLVNKCQDYYFGLFAISLSPLQGFLNFLCYAYSNLEIIRSFLTSIKHKYFTRKSADSDNNNSNSNNNNGIGRPSMTHNNSFHSLSSRGGSTNTTFKKFSFLFKDNQGGSGSGSGAGAGRALSSSTETTSLLSASSNTLSSSFYNQEESPLSDSLTNNSIN